MEQRGMWTVLAQQDEDDELRMVAAREMPDGSVEVEERTDGELTALTYGTLTCVRKLTVAQDAIEAMLWALGPCEGGALAALGCFFGEGERFLSDLQDVLDAGGVPYAFAVACGNNYALRRYA